MANVHTRSRIRQRHPDHDNNNDNANDLQHTQNESGDGDDIYVPIHDVPDIRVAIKQAAEYTAPGVNLIFIGLFCCIAYFHEKYTGYTGVAIAFWITLQFINQAIDEDFRNDLFWNLISSLGNAAMYLFIGYIWTHAKLYLDVWQGHLPMDLTKQVQTCLSANGENGCFVKFLFDIKWLIVRWMLTWPVSMAYTLSRDPLRIATDLAFEWSRLRYIYIIQHALSHKPGDTGHERIYLLWWVLYFVGYIVIGYLWTHVKLFIDVWQARLPRKLDDELRDVYQRNASYWGFVRKVKWLIMRWVLTWPFSMVHTILRNPLRIVAEFVYKLSQRKYVAITHKAMDWRGQAAQQAAEEEEEEEE